MSVIRTVEGSRWTATVGHVVACGLVLLLTGCQMIAPRGSLTVLNTSLDAPVETAKELSKTVLPEYRIEPPDILVIEATRIIPRPPYHLRTFDALNITAAGAPADAPINGVYRIEPGGMVQLGEFYGSVQAAGMTLEQAQQAIDAHLRQTLRDPMVTVSLAEMATMQQIAGEHLVAPDGTVNLGVYGSVPVVGLTLQQAKQVIEAHLAQYLEDPEVAVDVYSYNSKKFYIILQGAGFGDVVQSFPVTGNETVLDALALVNGTQRFSSKKMWIARPAPCGEECQILPVDWNAVAALGSPATNYQILPGDRLFIAEDKNVALGSWIDKVVSPWERVMGFAMLGAEAATRFSGNVLRGGGNPRGSGF